MFRPGERGAGDLRLPVEKVLTTAGLRVDYVTLADPQRLFPIADEARAGERALLAVAAFAGPHA